MGLSCVFNKIIKYLSFMEERNMDELSKAIESSNDIKVSLDKITEHVINKDFYYRSAYKISEGVILSEDYTNQNQRRSYYLDSLFKHSNLQGVGFSDSIFRNTQFCFCNLDGSNFESCYIFDCKFSDILEYKFTSFAKSLIYNTVMENGSFQHCRLADATFLNSTFTNCNFDNTSFDGAIFENCIFDNISFKNLNLEYVQFHNIMTNDTVLPFPTIPFIINGLTYLLNTTDNVRIKSAKYGSISKEEYLNLLPYLTQYYEYSKNYFPLANIYIAVKDTNRVFETIKYGIYQSILLNNYRQLKNYCLLAQVCSLLSTEQKKELFNVISVETNKLYTQKGVFYSSITEHISHLRDILLIEDTCSVIISFKTNIQNDDYENLSLFYKFLNTILIILGIKSKYNINFTYNSQAEIVSTITSLDTAVIVALISAVTTLIISGIKGLSNLPEVIQKFASIKNNLNKEKQSLYKIKLENKKLELEIQSLQLENQKTQYEINKQIATADTTMKYIDKISDNVQPVLAICEKMKNAGVCIERINCNAVNIKQNTLTDFIKKIIYGNINNI